ncbi:MAG: hypothetical protein AABM42_11575 [Actinomycetota bacterium]
MSRVAIVLGVLGLLLIAPSTAAAARSEFFGIVQGPTLDGQDLQGIAAARVRTNRFVLPWGSVQPVQGPPRWGPADRFIGRLASRGIRAVPAVWGNPDWVAGSASTPPIGGPVAEQAWRNFLKALVARYGPAGSYWSTGYRQRYGADANPLPIQSWQIWNEPNLKSYFAPYPSPGKYARLLQISHDAIKNRDPRAQIVLAGMPGNGDLKAWDFLDRLYSVPRIKRKFDAAALHPYAPNLDRQRQDIERLREVMTNRADEATPLWLTEVGWGSAPLDRFGINKGLTGQQQMLSGSFRMILNRRSTWNVQRLFWYRWRDPLDAAARCSFCGSAGLLSYDRTTKPAYSTFRSFTAETTPPQASITGGPAQGSFIKDSTPSFSYASNEAGSTFVCRVDASLFKPCSSPYTTLLLADGNHTLFVQAIDAPGNVSQVVSRRFTVDTHAPAVTMTSGPADGSISPDRSPSFSFASNGSGASFSCKLDGGGFEGCDSPSTASGLADASHTFQVRAADRAGNRSPTVSRTWTVDGPADVSITAGPQNGDHTNDPTPSFAFFSTDSGASFSCRIDGASYASCTSPLTTSMLSDGDHRFTVRATDAAQNTAAVSHAFTVDTTAPGMTISSGPVDRSTTDDPTPTFRFSPTEPGSTFQCRYEGHGFSACSGASSDTAASPLEDGPHAFWVRGIDAAGNQGDGLDVKFLVDTAAPELKIKGPSKTTTRRDKAAATFALKASEHVGLRCRIDSRRFKPCSWRYRTPKLSRGTHTVNVKATDRAGNVGTKRKLFEIARKLPKLPIGVPLTAASAPSNPRCHRVAATLIGSPHADRLLGTNGPDVIVGFGGDDRINGRGGRDRICGRRGDDQVTAGWGDDRILGGPGSDDIWGGAGRDMIRGASGFDLCGGAPAFRRFRCEDGG